MNVTLETLMFEHTNKAPQIMASMNVATALATKDNIQKLSKELSQDKKKIGLLEEHLLETRRE